MNSITVNGVEYVPATDKPSDVQIVVVDGRWNFIARVSREPGFVSEKAGGTRVFWCYDTSVGRPVPLVPSTAALGG